MFDKRLMALCPESRKYIAGVFLPVLPTTPFYLATVFFFANSSEKLHGWFLGTKLYKKHLASFVKGQGMLRSTKLSIIGSVTFLMAVGFFLMARKGIWIPCIILTVVWIAHIIYFGFRVKTIPQKISGIDGRRNQTVYK